MRTITKVLLTIPCLLGVAIGFLFGLIYASLRTGCTAALITLDWVLER